MPAGRGVWLAGQSGFALVITLVLLALLVLTLYALTALSKAGSEVAATSIYQTQARQNALLGLHTAMGELQRYAGEDDVLTGIAGITGVPAGGGNPARHWGGVWDGNGQFFRWLASGASGPLIPGLTGPASIALLANGALGADGTDKEYVRVLLTPITLSTSGGTSFQQGSYAWWVGDEGVKLSAVLPNERHALDELLTLSPVSPALPNALSYEQIALVPASVSPAVLAGQLRTNFHAIGRTHLSYVGATPVPGLLNINSTSARFWRGVAATYNRLKASGAPAIAPTSFANWMSAHFTATDPGAGKGLNGPYPSVDLFLNSTALTQALATSGGSLLEFGNVMRPWLTVRSDTFRLRAYGEALNPSDPTRTEATAWCEAIVQRVKTGPAATTGRFVITYFRWLGTDDI